MAPGRDGQSAPSGNAVAGIKSAFCEHLGNDLHLPAALAFAWTLARDQSVSATEKLEAFAFFDRVFGLGLEATGERALTAAQASLIEAREEARRRHLPDAEHRPRVMARDADALAGARPNGGYSKGNLTSATLIWCCR
jgi:hypothetical protein